MDSLTHGETPSLVPSATPLLLFSSLVRDQIEPQDFETVRERALEEMHAFEEQAKPVGVSVEDVLAARHVLCALIDEAVLSTPWGAQSMWREQSPLVTFHHDSSGGAQFFQIVDYAMSEPRRHIALLELLYVCLALGFEGQFRFDERGPAILEERRRSLYLTIEALRRSAQPELSPNCKGIKDRRDRVFRRAPLWLAVSACGALLTAAFIFCNARLSSRVDSLSVALSHVGLEAPHVAEPPPVAVARASMYPNAQD